MDGLRRRPNRYGMTTELIVLTWGCVLAAVHIFAAVQAKTRQYGTKWNIGARDESCRRPSRWSAGWSGRRRISTRPSRS